MGISWKNIENWQSWKMRFFWGGHFEFSKSAILNFFLLHLCEKSSPFIWGIIFFCTMDVFSRILEKKLSELLCTRLYMCYDKDEFWNCELKTIPRWIGLKWYLILKSSKSILNALFLIILHQTFCICVFYFGSIKE